jgi:hypothetical protein
MHHAFDRHNIREKHALHANGIARAAKILLPAVHQD